MNTNDKRLKSIKYSLGIIIRNELYEIRFGRGAQFLLDCFNSPLKPSGYSYWKKIRYLPKD